MALATLLTPSAFAENRHRNGTGSRGSDGAIRRDSGRSEQRSSRNVDRNRGRSSDQRSTRNVDRNRGRSSDQRSTRNFDRNRDRSSEQRSTPNVDRNRDRSSEQRSSRDWDRNRSGSTDRRGDRGRSREIDTPRTDRHWSPSSRNMPRNGWRGGSDRRFDREPYWASGRVRHFERWNGGYRVWIGGVTYPFWVPLSYYDRYPFRVGLSIRLGGHYNPLGYFEYYDGYSGGYRGGRYTDGSYRDRTIAAGTLRGVVESVDYSRGTFILRNDATDNLVTVTTRDRYVDEMRAGDVIEVEGDWTRSGLFEADRVDLLDRHDDRDRDDR